MINWDKTNTDHVTAIIKVDAKPEKDVGYDRIAAKISRFDEVTDLYLMSGESSFSVVIQGRTMREVSDFVAQSLAPIEGVINTSTSFMLRQYKVEGVDLLKDKDKDERQLVQP